jgi:hypothetical protein
VFVAVTLTVCCLVLMRLVRMLTIRFVLPNISKLLSILGLKISQLIISVSRKTSLS